MGFHGGTQEKKLNFRKLNWQYRKTGSIYECWWDETTIYGTCFKIEREWQEPGYRVVSYPSLKGTRIFDTLEEAQRQCQKDLIEIVMGCLEEEASLEVNCQTCDGSKIELVYGGNGNVLEFPCSMCCEKDTVEFRLEAKSPEKGGYY